MHWAYYVLIAAAVVVLLNVLIVVYVAMASREARLKNRNDTPFNET